MSSEAPDRVEVSSVSTARYRIDGEGVAADGTVRLDVGHVLPDLWPAGLRSPGIVLALACSYAAAKPVPDLLDAIAARTANMSVDAAGRQLTLSPGARAALHAVFVAVATASAPPVIAVAAPRWPMYERLAAVAGATLQTVARADAPDGLTPDLLSTVRPAPAAVLVTRPNNPDGRHLSVARLIDIATWCTANGALLVIDGVYQALGNERDDLEPALARAERWVVIDGVSKRLGLAGVRVGWATTADADLDATVGATVEALYAGVSAAAQQAAFVALTEVDTSALAAVLDARRVRFLAGLSAAAIDYVEPQAGPFVMVRAPVDGVPGPQTPAARLAEVTGVASGDATAHGAPGWVRMNFSVTPAELDAAIERLGRRG